MEDINNVHIFYVTLFFQIHFCSFKNFFYEKKIAASMDGVQLVVTYSAKMHMSPILDEKYVIKLWLQEKKNFSCGFLNEQ